VRKLWVPAWLLLLVPIMGAALFYLSDDPFDFTFAAGLWLLIGGTLLCAFALAVALARTRWRGVRVLGWVCAAFVVLVAAAVATLAFDYRLLLFPRVVSKEDWRRDLRFVAETIENRHPAPFARMSRNDFVREVGNIERDLEGKTDAQIIMQLVKLGAMLQDGHSTLFPFQPATGFHMYPLQLYYFDDGLYVTQTAAPYRMLVGQRVVRIGDRTVEEASALLRTFVGADNEWTVKDRIQHYLLCPEVLQSQGIIGQLDGATFTFGDDSGQETALKLEPVGFLKYFYWYFRPLAEWKRKPRESDLPLYRRRQGENYWFEYLDSSRTLYMAFNQVRDESGESFDNFGSRVLDLCRERGCERLVIDVRNNSGGDNYLFREFVEKLSRSDVNRRGKLFTLIGRHTFSAAVNFVSMMERRTETLFVGEPTGAGPNHYGDTRRYLLPGSRAFLFVSTLCHEWSEPGDTRRAHEPNLGVALTHTDYFAGRDPVLNAALNYRPRPHGASQKSVDQFRGR